ncbi:uncharacterized protein [Apostichopus japonicus]|uniref:uncharacterized protein isoform X2 n=1 Tax=Stichopus japonicus TaxID=307972 RepID=UPI003AB35C87
MRDKFNAKATLDRNSPNAKSVSVIARLRLNEKLACVLTLEGVTIAETDEATFNTYGILVLEDSVNVPGNNNCRSSTGRQFIKESIGIMPSQTRKMLLLVNQRKCLMNLLCALHEVTRTTTNNR